MWNGGALVGAVMKELSGAEQDAKMPRFTTKRTLLLSNVLRAWPGTDTAETGPDPLSKHATLLVLFFFRLLL